MKTTLKWKVSTVWAAVKLFQGSSVNYLEDEMALQSKMIYIAVLSHSRIYYGIIILTQDSYKYVILKYL